MRLLEREAEVAGDVEERLLDEPGDHAGVGAAAGDRRRAAGGFAAQAEDGLAQSVVGAGGGTLAPVEVEAGPRLGHRVDVEAAEFAGERHDVPRGGVDRKVDAETLAAAGRQQGREDVPVVVAGERDGLEADAALVEKAAVAVGGVDHDEAALVELEMTLDQGQGAAADGAEADHDDRPADAAVHGPVGHGRGSWEVRGAGGDAG